MEYPAPVLYFEDSAGLDLPGFCTVRLSRGWANRLVVGNVVFLASGNYILGRAKVALLDSGRLPDMLSIHARNTHVELANKNQFTDASTAPVRVRERMLKMFGPLKVTDNAYLSVIYLRHLKT